MNSEWVREIQQRCTSVAIPFFFKHWGGANKEATGRELEGRMWNEMPTPRIRQRKSSRVLFPAEGLVLRPGFPAAQIAISPGRSEEIIPARRFQGLQSYRRSETESFMGESFMGKNLLDKQPIVHYLGN
jgi:hypothetical protein